MAELKEYDVDLVLSLLNFFKAHGAPTLNQADINSALNMAEIFSRHKGTIIEGKCRYDPEDGGYIYIGDKSVSYELSEFDGKNIRIIVNEMAENGE